MDNFSRKRSLTANPIEGFARVCVLLVEKVLPDPFVIAALITAGTFVLALTLMPHANVIALATHWYDGVFGISSFAFVAALMLVTGHAFSSSRVVTGLLRKAASVPTTPTGAMLVIFFVSMFAAMSNWAFGLIVSGLLAREIAKRVKVDFAWLVAAGYAGWTFFVCGFSSAVALICATANSPMNVLQKITGKVLPLSSFLFSPMNLVPVSILAVLIPLVFIKMAPKGSDIVVADSSKLMDDAPAKHRGGPSRSFAGRLNDFSGVNLFLAALGIAYIVSKLIAGTFTLDLNAVVMIFLILGLVTHWTPRAYLSAVENAARVTGPVLIQFPLYGGIMAMMTSSGLADMIAKLFIGISTAHTLPFWTFVSSAMISIFVPSAGGHWVVQAPFVVPAAQHLGTSQTSVVVAVALGEAAADMIQPMWVIPLLTIAGVGMGRVMGFAVMIFILMMIVMGASLLLL